MNLDEKVSCKVPFGTVNIPEKAKTLINQALDAKMVTNGSLVKEFEIKFAEKFGAKYAVAVSSGTDAVTLALASLYSLGAERGDEVILPALTFVATANAVVAAGFTPVFCDVEVDTFNIDPNLIEYYITPKTRAILVVHLMGKPARMDAILETARVHKLNVIEDTAEAHGATYRGKMCGTIAPISAFSCYAAHIVTSIEGGMVLTSSNYVSETIKSLRNHGLELKGSNWTFDKIGFSSKMNELEAAVGLANLEDFDSILARRRHNFDRLNKGFASFRNHFATLSEEPHEKIGPHAFPIVIRQDSSLNKDEFVWFLSDKGIDNRNLFYSLPTQSKAYKSVGTRYGSYATSEYLSNNGTHIGVHQDLSDEQIDYVLECVSEYVKVRG